MRCQKCLKETRTIAKEREKLDGDGWQMIVRTRICPDGHQFQTFECYEYADTEVVFRVREVLTMVDEALKIISKHGAGEPMVQ